MAERKNREADLADTSDSGPMTNGSGKTQVRVGALNNTGNGFTTTFSHR
jgi:hypothetical protein